MTLRTLLIWILRRNKHFPGSLKTPEQVSITEKMKIISPTIHRAFKCHAATDPLQHCLGCHPTPFHPTPVQDWVSSFFFRSCAGSLGEAAPPGIDETNSGRSLIPRATLIDNWLHIWIVRFTFFFCQRLTAVIFIAPFPDATILPPWLGFTCHLPQNSRQNGIILLPPWLWVHVPPTTKQPTERRNPFFSFKFNFFFVLPFVTVTLLLDSF